MKIDTDDLIKQSTAARMRGVSTPAITGLIQRGKLTTVVIDGNAYLLKKEIENFKPDAPGPKPKPVRENKISPPIRFLFLPGGKVKIDIDDLIKQTTAARMRGVSKQAIVRLVQRGKLRKVVIDGDTFVYKEEVKDFKPGTAGRPKKTADKKPAKRRSRKSK